MIKTSAIQYLRVFESLNICTVVNVVRQRRNKRVLFYKWKRSNGNICRYMTAKGLKLRSKQPRRGLKLSYKKAPCPPFMASLFYCLSAFQLYIQFNDWDTEKDQSEFSYITIIRC